MSDILEIGSGHGFDASILARSNSVTGIDLSKRDVKVARQRYPHVKFLVMNAEKMTFADSTFDCVYAIDILEHVDSIENVIREVNRVLRDGGKFIINIPHFNSEKWLLNIRPTYFKEIHHVRVFQENELDKLLITHKFKIIKKKPRGFLQHVELYLLFKRKINSSTQLSIGSWRDTYFTMLVHIGMLFFDTSVLKTPLVYFPVWIFTLPIGMTLNFFGNKIFPKSFYYEAIKIKKYEK